MASRIPDYPKGSLLIYRCQGMGGTSEGYTRKACTAKCVAAMASMPSFRSRVAGIVARAAFKQMIRIHAARIVTVMAGEKV